MAIAILIIIMCVIIVSLLIGNYFCNIALNPKVSKKYILRTFTEKDKEEENKNKIDGEEWLKEFATEIEILSEDDLKLHGYKVINPMKRSNTWVILAHGYMGKSCEMVQYAKRFIDFGYNTLLVDLRAHGKSEGKYIGMGWKDRKDIIKWINELCEEEKDCQIILYGVSMGAATMLMTLGESPAQNVKMCIEDCGYTSVYRQFEMMLKVIKPYLAEYLMMCANIVAKFKMGYNFTEASSINQIKKSNIPILFIHGDRDKFVPYEMLDELYEEANLPKEKLVIKNAGHVESSKINPELYWKTIKQFINRNLE